MNQTTNTALGRKQLIAIVLVLLLGGAGAAAILGARPASEAGHGHDEAKGHADAEHHGEEKDGHDHDHAEGVNTTRNPRKARSR